VTRVLTWSGTRGVMPLAPVVRASGLAVDLDSDRELSRELAGEAAGGGRAAIRARCD
jgi:hypothetical protein